MKVLYVCPSPTFYGDNIALMNIMPYLEKMGVEPFFLIQRQEGGFSEYLKSKGYKFTICPFIYNNIYGLKHPIRSFFVHTVKSTIWNLRKSQYINKAIDCLGDFKPDLVHTNNSANSFGLLLSKKLCIPHIWHIREYSDLDHNLGFFPTKRCFERNLNEKNNTNIFITDGVASHYSHVDKKVVIYDGVIENETECETNHSLKKENTIIYVGRLIETKGVLDIIQAFASLKNKKDYCLSFIGDGDETTKQRMRLLSKELGIGDRVKFLGYKSNVFEYMQKAKAIIVSSRFEAFGFITAEAMFNHCAVIGRNTAGTKLQFDNGLNYTGREVGFRYNSIKDLTLSIETVIECQETELERMLDSAYKTVIHFYLKSKSAESVMKIYRNLLLK